MIDAGDGPVLLLLHAFPCDSRLWLEQARAAVDAGLDGVVALGSNGEAFNLSDRERVEVLTRLRDVLPTPLMVQPTVESFEAALLERHGGKSPVAV